MDRRDRLKAVYDYLRKKGYIHTQKAFAIALGKAEGTMSKAFKGDEKSLTDNLFVQITLTFPGLFNLDYLLTGEGELLMGQGSAKSPDKSGELEALKSRIQVLEEQVSRQRQLIDHYESFVDLLTRMQNDTNRPFTPDNTAANILDNQ